MRGAKHIASLLCLCALSLAACKGASGKALPAQANLQSGKAFTAEDFAKLRATSCPDHASFITPQAIPLTATPIAPDTLKGAMLNGLHFAGGWHLTSDEPNFGGLSGLTVHPKDHLLAVSDAGAFIWISMSNDAPSGFAAISYMRDEKGQLIQDKADGDSEGIELVGGLALVSFERNHRIMAFDVGNCGAAANGVLVTDIPEQDGRPITDNRGAEALALSASGHLLAGFESQQRRGAPIVELASDRTASWDILPGPADKLLVGLDQQDGTVFSLFRNYLPILGNQIDIQAHSPESAAPLKIASLSRPFPVDNFEGITATRLEDGTIRLYIISDDNFSSKQRTLLLAFDVLASAPAN